MYIIGAHRHLSYEGASGGISPGDPVLPGLVQPVCQGTSGTPQAPFDLGCVTRSHHNLCTVVFRVSAHGHLEFTGQKRG